MLLRSSGMFSNVALVLFTVFGAFARQRKLRTRARAPAHQRRSFSMSLASQPSPCRAVAAAVCFARHTMTICMCVCFTYIRVLQTHSIETCKTSSGRQRDQRTGGRVQQLQFLRRPRRLAAAFYCRVCVCVCVPSSPRGAIVTIALRASRFAAERTRFRPTTTGRDE